METYACVMHWILVDGVWSSWSAWDTCSVTCGGGTQTRTHTCTPPTNGGQHCQGSTSQQQSCNSKACPGKKYVNYN